MKSNTIYTIIAHFFMVLFIYTGLSKIMDINSFKLEMAASPILGQMAGIAAWVLPALELLLVAILFIPKTRLIGLYASLALMSLFTIYMTVLLFVDNNLSCSCGGIIENLSPVQHLVFNIACIFLAVIGITSAKKQEKPNFIRYRWYSTGLSLLLFSAIGWTMLTAATTPSITRSGKEGTVIPVFDILLLDSITKLKTADIPTGKPFIVLDFSPYCPHCRGEITDITKNMEKLKGTHFYFISTFPIPILRSFEKEFNLSEYPNITVGQDNSNTFLSYFNWHKIPFTAIYDSKKRLSQAIYSRADIPVLTHCMNQ